MAEVTEGAGQNDYDQQPRSKFRFKSKKRKKSVEGDDGRRSKQSRRHRHDSPRRDHRKGRPTEPLNDDPSAYDDDYIYNARSGEYVDPDTLFRESLFDALADDEGAAYWEDVYGQPVHVYSDSKPGPSGTLERMTDEEYAEHVRSKMWEKTHQHVVEERERQARQREQRRKEADQEGESRRQYRESYERSSFLHDIDESLAKSKERSKEVRWKAAWQRYAQAWEKFTEVVVAKCESRELEGKAARGIIPWPVDTGKWKHVTKDDVDNFFRHAPPTSDLQSMLKAERVRWHPDKMQQRFGAQRLDEETTRSVTLVFQVVDSIWLNLKNN